MMNGKLKGTITSATSLGCLLLLDAELNAEKIHINIGTNNTCKRKSLQH